MQVIVKLHEIQYKNMQQVHSYDNNAYKQWLQIGKYAARCLT